MPGCLVARCIPGAVVAAALAATLLAGCTGPGAGFPASESAVSQPPAIGSAGGAWRGGGPVPGTAASETPASPEGADCAPADCVDVVVTGDVLLHPALWEQAKRDGGGAYDFGPLLSGLRPFLAEAELAVCNLETPLAPEKGPYSGYPSFTVPRRSPRP